MTDEELIFIEFEGHQFLNCYVEPYISFYFYFSPFQSQLWAMLGISIVTLIAVTTIVYHYRKEKQKFSLWLFVLATLFEETGFMPSKVEKSTFYRISLGIWCIMSVIFTNGYNGLMIQELNAPRKLFHPDTFDHLRCQNLFDDYIDDYNLFWVGRNRWVCRFERGV